MARKKNLTKQDIDDVSTYETYSPPKTNGHNGISINDISIKIKCLNEKQKLLKNTIKEKEITISIGPAGTGKTYLTLLTALHLLKTEPRFKKIVLVKSLTTIKGEEVGFLPGTLWEKLEPFMYSFTGNLDKILGNKITKYLLQQDIIEIMPIAYIRGVTIDNSIIIVDEIQNLSMHTFKTIITRIGFNSKIIFLGDAEQSDLQNIQTTCINKIIPLFKNTKFAGVVEFFDEDCVRNPIIKDILSLMRDI